jgi:hypothetical protein
MKGGRQCTIQLKRRLELRTIKDDQGQIISHVAAFSDFSEAVLLKPVADIQKKCVTRN